MLNDYVYTAGRGFVLGNYVYAPDVDVILQRYIYTLSISFIPDIYMRYINILVKAEFDKTRIIDDKVGSIKIAEVTTNKVKLEKII